MSKRSRLTWLIGTIIVFVASAPGCNSLEEGLRDGVVKGSSAALAEFIKAPAVELVNTLFPNA